MLCKKRVKFECSALESLSTTPRIGPTHSPTSVTGLVAPPLDLMEKRSLGEWNGKKDSTRLFRIDDPGDCYDKS